MFPTSVCPSNLLRVGVRVESEGDSKEEGDSKKTEIRKREGGDKFVEWRSFTCAGGH